MAGFKITHGIELMENAVENANFNLSIKKGAKAEHICGDITKLDADFCKNQIGPNGCIVIGGPPCQAYSLIGRGKLNSLRAEGSFVDDKRGYLFEDYLRIAIGLDAKAIIMENVKSCTDFGGVNVPEKAAEILEKHGYSVHWTILNSADFGVPQVRERMLLFAYKGDMEFVLPKPTHSGAIFPDIVVGTGLKELSKCSHFVMPKKRNKRYPAWVTVGEAIGDLASLQVRPEDPYTAYSVNDILPYVDEPENEYQKLMRKGMGSGVSANSYRKTPRDYPIFARMQEGDDFVAAGAIADQLLVEACEREGVEEGSIRYKELKAKIVPPYSREKFLSKWKKLDRSKPSHTLVAHLSVDTYSHIHPWEPRGISVREAARLQSFPDDYVFHSNMGDAFKQIGNAVPPLLALGIAKAVKATLSAEVKKHE